MSWFDDWCRALASRAGNAVLVSVIIMASALTTSIGLAAVVTKEIGNVANIPAAERAYYKSESYIEQALWEKMKGPLAPGYAIDGSEWETEVKPNPYLCAANPCFGDGSAPEQFLTDFLASSVAEAGPQLLRRDVPLPLEIDPTLPGGAKAASATVTLADTTDGTIRPSDAAAFKGVEVTVVAYPPPDSATFPDLSRASGDPLAGSTPVFVDKITVPAAGASIPIGLGAPNNSSGEAYPSLQNYRYELRLRALGSDALITPKLQSNGAALRLLSANYRVRAVTGDGLSQRGVQVLTPVVRKPAGIFDYVLFADLSLEKLSAKAPPSAATPSPTGPQVTSFSRNGNQFSDCTERNNPEYCRVNYGFSGNVTSSLGGGRPPGSSTNDPPFVATYSSEPNMKAGTYNLILRYRNWSSGHIPSGYKYHVGVRVGNGSVTYYDLALASPADFPATANIPITLPAGSSRISIIWDNHLYGYIGDGNDGPGLMILTLDVRQ